MKLTTERMIKWKQERKEEVLDQRNKLRKREKKTKRNKTVGTCKDLKRCRYVEQAGFFSKGFFNAEDHIQWIFFGLHCSYLSLYFQGHASCSSLCRCVEQQRMAVTCAGRHGACPNGKWTHAYSQKKERKDFESLESSFRLIVVNENQSNYYALLEQTKMSQGANESSP